VSTAAVPPPAIEASGLTKQFGAVFALDRVDLRVEQGESLAVFGPNGAGKTTLIRALTLGLRPGQGSFRVSGMDPRTDALEIRRNIGLISHQSLLYDQLSVTENLEFFARLYGVEDPRRRSAELLAAMELEHRSGSLAGTLSRGLGQRVSIARALVHDPGILFLDEPFTGLDPHAAELLRSTLQKLRDRGRSVLIATHNLQQGLDLSDRWFLLLRGRVAQRGASKGTDPATLERAYAAGSGRAG